MILSTVEQGIKDLLSSEVDNLSYELEATCKAYNLPTDEMSRLEVIVAVAQGKIEDLKKIDKVKL